jgi:hypothetical protein
MFFTDAMRNLPTSDDDKYHNSYPNKVCFNHIVPCIFNDNGCKVTTSSAALDLAHISQTSPRSHFRALDSREKSSEWPQFTGVPRGPDGLASRSDRRTVTNPSLTLSASPDDRPVPATATPLLQQHSQGHNHGQAVSSRRGSPPNLHENLTVTTRSVPATPLSGVPGNPSHLKTPATPHTPDTHALSSRVSSQSSHQVNDNTVNAAELQASLSRISPSQYEDGSMAYDLDEVYFIFMVAPLFLCDSSSMVWIIYTLSVEESTTTLITGMVTSPVVGVV